MILFAHLLIHRLLFVIQENAGVVENTRRFASKVWMSMVTYTNLSLHLLICDFDFVCIVSRCVKDEDNKSESLDEKTQQIQCKV